MTGGKKKPPLLLDFDAKVTAGAQWVSFVPPSAGAGAVPASAPIPQGEEEQVVGSEINVPPVTGMTPAQVATELRILIRDKLWHGIKSLETTPKVSGSAQNYSQSLDASWAAVYEARVKLHQDLNDLMIISQRRKPSETKAKITQMINEGSYRNFVKTTDTHHVYADRLRQRALTKAVATASSLLLNAQRAYALVQALPTIDNPSLGKAENTLRAVTAIIKVYHGVDTAKTAKALPDVMEQLLTSIKPDPITKTKEVVTSNDQFAKPFRIHSSSGYDITDGWNWAPGLNDGTAKPYDQKHSHGFAGNGEGSYENWNYGDCSIEDAVQFLIWCKGFFPERFTLRDQTKKILATAYAGMPVYLNYQEEVEHATVESAF